jgi:hypothetical protein
LPDDGTVPEAGRHKLAGMAFGPASGPLSASALFRQVREIPSLQIRRRAQQQDTAVPVLVAFRSTLIAKPLFDRVINVGQVAAVSRRDLQRW